MIVAVFLPPPIYLLGAWKRTHLYMETYLSIYSTALFDVVQCDLCIYSQRRSAHNSPPTFCYLCSGLLLC